MSITLFRGIVEVRCPCGGFRGCPAPCPLGAVGDTCCLRQVLPVPLLDLLRLLVDSECAIVSEAPHEKFAVALLFSWLQNCGHRMLPSAMVHTILVAWILCSTRWVAGGSGCLWLSPRLVGATGLDRALRALSLGVHARDIGICMRFRSPLVTRAFACCGSAHGC